MKILLPVDGSPSSCRAVRYVIRHFATGRAQRRTSLLLLHVDPPLPARAARLLAPDARAGFHEEYSERAARPARRLLRDAGVKFVEQHAVGDPAALIIALAKKPGVDLIAMGSHGRGAFLSAVLGSVVVKVLSRSKVPVLVVR